MTQKYKGVELVFECDHYTAEGGWCPESIGVSIQDGSARLRIKAAAHGWELDTHPILDTIDYCPSHAARTQVPS